MSDRVSQIQLVLNQLTEMFYTSIGVMQRDAPLVQVNPAIPITAWTAEQLEKNETELQTLSKEISKDIVDTVRVLDFLIDHLPGIEETEQQQIDRLTELQAENVKAGQELEEQIAVADELLLHLKTAINNIAEKHLEPSHLLEKNLINIQL